MLATFIPATEIRINPVTTAIYPHEKKSFAPVRAGSSHLLRAAASC
jgi:hypothetical protein